MKNTIPEHYLLRTQDLARRIQQSPSPERERESAETQYCLTE